MTFRIRGESKLTTLSRIHPNKYNPNTMNDRQYKAVKEAIEEYGFLDELLVRPHPEHEEEYEVIDGEHRYRAVSEYMEANNLEVPIRVIDADDAEAKKLTVIMNETRGRADTMDLAALLVDIEQTLGSSATGIGLPYTDAELTELLELGKSEWGDYLVDVDGGGGATTEEKWEEFIVRMSPEDYAAYKDARRKIEEAGETLSEYEDIAHGQVIAAIAREYVTSFGGV